MFSIRELIDVILMTGIVGYLVMDFFPSPNHDPFRVGFDWDRFKFSCLVTAPGIIIHELGHKFMAMAFGLNATFHAAYGWMGFGLFLKLIGSGFLFFVPAYVSFTGAVAPIQSALIAFAGPAINLILYLLAIVVLKNKPRKRSHAVFWIITKRVNGFLFLFNMIPIGLFDGAKVFAGLIQHFL
ncbi:MAG: M50 family metallopeptidase [Candidatus Nanoarchaeia archaeon]